MAYPEAGVPLAIGSDSQVRIDPFEEARELETGVAPRAPAARRGCWPSVGDLWAELCQRHRSLGLPDGTAPRPTVTLDLEHPDLRGIEPADLPLALVTCASAGVVRQD